MVKFAAMLVAMLIQAFTFCYAGQFLRNKVDINNLFFSIQILFFYLLFIFKGKMITQAIFECPWYKIEAQEAKTLIIVFKRSLYPVTLTGGKFYTLNNECFLQVRIF